MLTQQEWDLLLNSLMAAAYLARQNGQEDTRQAIHALTDKLADLQPYLLQN